MNIEKAKALKIGDIVNYPADRGDKAGRGIVAHVSDTVNTSYQGNQYIWVSLKGGGVWPSNRLNK